MTRISRRGGLPRPLRSILSLAAASAIATTGLAAVTLSPSAAASVSFTASGTPAAIPYSQDDVIEVPFTVTGSPSTSKIEITVTFNHPCVKELAARLIAPAGGTEYANLFYDNNRGPCTGTATQSTYTFVEDNTRAPGSFNGPNSNDSTNTYTPVESFSEYFANSVSNGTWLLRVADNFAGNEGTLTSATLTFTNPDTSTGSAPTTEITSGPAEGSVSGSSVTFGFSASSKDFGGFECRLVSGYLLQRAAARNSTIISDGWSACLNPASYQLPPGGYTFGVRALANDATPGEPTYRNFSVGDSPVVDEGDSGGPNVAIVSGPEDGATVDTAPTYGFTTPADDFAGYECTLDGYFLPSCPNPITLTDVDPGTHVFGVRGVDADGNRGALTTRTFTLTEPAPSQACTDAQAAYDAAVAKVADLRERIKAAKAQGKDTKVKRLKAKLATAKAERDAAETRIETDC